jgi:hypothetical protein
VTVLQPFGDNIVPEIGFGAMVEAGPARPVDTVAASSGATFSQIVASGHFRFGSLFGVLKLSCRRDAKGTRLQLTGYRAE